MRLVVFAIAALGVPATARAQTPIPDAHLEVTVQQREGGDLRRGLHLLHLSCWDGHCSLTSLTLNQCVESGEGQLAFYPKVQRSSTLEGNLIVQRVGNTLVATETGDMGGAYVNNLRFDYLPPHSNADAITQLTGFSGGFVKNSAILKKVLTVEYVPLPGRDQVITLDCGALLPGVQKE